MLRLFHTDSTKYELCIDEVGRGCLFGPTHIACVVLSKNETLDTSNIKDSKKFSSKTKIRKVAEYIKSTALYYHIAAVDNETIDKINILVNKRYLKTIGSGFYTFYHFEVQRIKNK